MPWSVQWPTLWEPCSRPMLQKFLINGLWQQFDNLPSNCVGLITETLKKGPQNCHNFCPFRFKNIQRKLKRFPVVQPLKKFKSVPNQDLDNVSLNSLKSGRSVAVGQPSLFSSSRTTISYLNPTMTLWVTTKTNLT